MSQSPHQYWGSGLFILIITLKNQRSYINIKNKAQIQRTSIKKQIIMVPLKNYNF